MIKLKKQLKTHSMPIQQQTKLKPQLITHRQKPIKLRMQPIKLRMQPIKLRMQPIRHH